MGKIFDLESPLMSFLNKLADLIFLNILAAVCCLPIITIGASMTALNYVVLKIVRNEEGYITKAFFKSFKQNFKQATIIWLTLLLVACVLVGDYLIFTYSGITFPTWLKVTLVAIGIVVLFATMHVFPVLSRFENTILNTYKNSLFMGILTLPKTVCMMVCWAIPVVISAFFPQILPVVFALGISGPTFLCALLYNGTFKRFEPETEEAEEWTVQEEGEEQEEKGEESKQQTEEKNAE